MRADLGVCVVRAWRPDDGPSLARHADNRRIWTQLRDRFPHPYRLRDANAFLAKACDQDPVTHFAIEVDGEAAGGVGLQLHEDVERVSAEIGYWLGEAHWGRGIVTTALREVTWHALATLGLTRVFALPFATNVASVRVLEKAGFALEGRLRRSAIKEGVVVDQLLYSFTDRDVSPKTGGRRA
jgi:[ribosomal protein S5]-alanine N-acetyltransferase